MTCPSLLFAPTTVNVHRRVDCEILSFSVSNRILGGRRRRTVKADTMKAKQRSKSETPQLAFRQKKPRSPDTGNDFELEPKAKQGV